MKNIISINKLLLVVLSLAMFSCADDFLDEKPIGAPTADKLWSSEKTITAAVQGLYVETTGRMYDRAYFWYINASDDMVTGRVKSDPDNMKNFVCTGNEGYTRGEWGRRYKVIKRANDIIINLKDKKGVDKKIIDRALGEAYFMSGTMYYELAYRFGDKRAGVPIIDRKDLKNFNQPRSKDVIENYKYVIAELEKAANLLPYFEKISASERGRAHKTAAWAYMAKTYLFWAQYDKSKYAKAVEMADKVINSGKHALVKTGNPAKDFRAVFTAKENWGKEYIWSVNSSAALDEGSILPGVMLENKGWGKYNGWGYFQPTKELFDAYVTGDVRRDVTIFKEGTIFPFFGEKSFKWTKTSNNQTGYMFGKYMDPFKEAKYVSTNGDHPCTDLNVPLMRFAEVLLIKAEALIADGKNGDVPLNKIRARAGLKPLSGAKIEDLKRERRCELAGEWSDRHFDLVRWGDADKTYAQPLHGFDGKEVWPARPQYNPNIHHVWPIPPFEIEKSNGVLKQNAGW